MRSWVQDPVPPLRKSNHRRRKIKGEKKKQVGPDSPEHVGSGTCASGSGPAPVFAAPSPRGTAGQPGSEVGAREAPVLTPQRAKDGGEQRGLSCSPEQEWTGVRGVVGARGWQMLPGSVSSQVLPFPACEPRRCPGNGPCGCPALCPRDRC